MNLSGRTSDDFLCISKVPDSRLLSSDYVYGLLAVTISANALTETLRCPIMDKKLHILKY